MTNMNVSGMRRVAVRFCVALVVPCVFIGCGKSSDTATRVGSGGSAGSDEYDASGAGSGGVSSDGNGGSSGTTTAGTSVQQVVAGIGHTCARLSNGSVWCWGANVCGQLGDCTYNNRATPERVHNLTQTVSIAAGNQFTCAVQSDGGIQCWGYNNYGQLGDGTALNRTVPAYVQGIASAAEVTAGFSHTCARLSDRTVRCWGRNDSGQLGNGTTINSSTPVAVKDLSNAIAIAAGDAFACALLDTGGVKCWGFNGNGQLGDGTISNRSTAVSVLGISGAKVVSTGSQFSCVVAGDGAVLCWGLQLDSPSNVVFDSRTPIAIQGLSNAVAVAAGDGQTCAVISDGSVSCWGRAPLGDGTLSGSNVPVLVQDLSNAVGVAAGVMHSCAWRADGTAWCWGSNLWGQIGDGTAGPTSTRLKPTLVNLSGVDSQPTDGGEACVDDNAVAPTPYDPGYIEGNPYRSGVYQCCAQGQGTSCCSSDAGTYLDSTCFQYGGVLGDCVSVGGNFSGKEPCAHCCAGLKRTGVWVRGPDDASVPSDPTIPVGCAFAGAIGEFFCIACGDGVCGNGLENYCTCPEDCPPP